MKINCLPSEKKINKGYLKANIVRANYDRFLLAFNKLMLHINDSESEEYNKNIIKTFLEDSFYKNHNFINTKDRNDLVIHRDNKPSSPVVVLVEAKSPANSSEMISCDKLNKKAFHELVLYYLRERIENRNYEIKKLIVTNAYEWFIFDASDFEKYFYVSEFKKEYEKWRDSAFVDVKTKTFYDFTEYKLRELDEVIDCVHLDLSCYAPESFLIKKQTNEDMTTLYKVFSPEFLTGKSYANDSNSLNKEFYYELLYIMGLEEVSEGSKKLIKRCGPKTRQDASIVENIIRKLESENRLDNIENIKEFGSTKEEQLFNIALQLALTWLNRILFMKLLESQLIRFNNGDKYYKFLDAGKITQFNDLNTLFFKVLNIREDERYKDLREKFVFLPYLNSSLFEITDLERNATDISGLEDNLTMPLYSKTVLKDIKGNRSKTKLLTQEYLLLFLDAYDFGQTVSKEIVDEDKPLINASVLGLVFEKINGYKDGSYFTPGFITMYMARESVRLATIQKFNDKFGWNLKEYSDLYNEIQKISIKEANEVIDDLKICDPAVGSGHFLVSVLNEIIAMKSELYTLIDEEGKLLRYYKISVMNDELHIEDEDGKLFDYHAYEDSSFYKRNFDSQKQRVQETIFREKRRIIENCLFGVDINPNSVQICRLRLWIELLKNAYYERGIYRTMETLPNIDINIKCGNSLVSKFDFSDVLPQKDLPFLEQYKLAVETYKNTTNRDIKNELKKTIEKIKSKFQGFWQPENKERMKLTEELHRLNTEKDLFASEKDKERIEQKKQKLTEKMEKLKEEEEKTKSNGLYWNAFEWRFEFPEVLDDNGNFTGFDIVIGNPPYGAELSNEQIQYLDNKFNGNKPKTKNSAIYFVFNSELLTNKRININSLIIPKSVCYSSGWFTCAEFIHSKILKLIDVGKAFDEVLLEQVIFISDRNSKNKHYVNGLYIEDKIEEFDLVDKEIFNRYKILLAGQTKEEIKLILKMLKKYNNTYGEFVEIQRGLNWQNKAVNNKGKTPIFRGAQLNKYFLSEPTDFISLKKFNQSEYEYQMKEKILNQLAIAHVQNPYPHFYLQSCYDYENILVYETISCTFRKNSKIDYKFLLALNNSKLFAWILYKFVYSCAIRSTRFDEQYVEKIPCPDLSKVEYKKIVKLTNRILKTKSDSDKFKDIQNQIDIVIYKLYNLTFKEVKTIDPNFHLNKPEYEKYELED